MTPNEHLPMRAFHEAGHAAVLIHFWGSGLWPPLFKSIDLRTKENSAARVSGVQYRTGTAQELSESVSVCYAGCLAAVIASERDLIDWDGLDLEGHSRQEWLRGGGFDDLTKARELVMGSKQCSQADADKFIGSSAESTYRLLWKLWPRVNAIARLLMQSPTPCSYEDVAMVCCMGNGFMGLMPADIKPILREGING